MHHRPVHVAGTVRSNVAVVEPDGTTTKVNEPGPILLPGEIDAVLTTALESAVGADWLVGSGSLPPGAPDDLYAMLVCRARAVGCRVAVDGSGVSMLAAVAAGPHLIKPNHEELAELVGHPLGTLGDVLDAAADLVSGGVERVVVSLGGDGAVLVDRDTIVHVRVDIAGVLSTVGAGDCTLAGLLAGLTAGDPPELALATGALWGSAAVTLPGSRVPAPADLDGLAVESTTSRTDRSPSPAEPSPAGPLAR